MLFLRGFSDWVGGSVLLRLGARRNEAKQQEAKSRFGPKQQERNGPKGNMERNGMRLGFGSCARFGPEREVGF